MKILYIHTYIYESFSSYHIIFLLVIFFYIFFFFFSFHFLYFLFFFFIIFFSLVIIYFSFFFIHLLILYYIIEFSEETRRAMTLDIIFIIIIMIVLFWNLDLFADYWWLFSSFLMRRALFFWWYIFTVFYIVIIHFFSIFLPSFSFTDLFFIYFIISALPHEHWGLLTQADVFTAAAAAFSFQHALLFIDDAFLLSFSCYFMVMLWHYRLTDEWPLRQIMETAQHMIYGIGKGREGRQGRSVMII